MKNPERDSNQNRQTRWVIERVAPILAIPLIASAVGLEAARRAINGAADLVEKRDLKVGKKK
jgi:hypothetical protein